MTIPQVTSIMVSNEGPVLIQTLRLYAL